MSRYVEMDDTAALVGQDQENVEDLEADRRHREEVDRDQGLDVIFKEGSPGLGGRPTRANHVFANAGFAGINAEFEQFTVDARSTPERIFPAHLADQITDFSRNAWPSDSAVTDFPSPEKSKALPVPSDHGLRLHDDEGRPPVGPELAQPRPKKPVGRSQFRLLDRSLQNTELMAKSKDLEM
jgi:hypothetical protein